MINLHNQGGFAVNIVEWDTFFPIVCWKLWKKRCRFVMEPGFFELSGNVVVDDIHKLLSRDWEVIIRKIPREMNKVADALAQSSRDDPMRLLLFDVPSIEVQHLVLMDKQGVDDGMVGDGMVGDGMHRP
ncbi:hypothetical protein V6N11_013969 [Hibiscus sabdariffa]